MLAGYASTEQYRQTELIETTKRSKEPFIQMDYGAPHLSYHISLCCIAPPSSVGMVSGLHGHHFFPLFYDRSSRRRMSMAEGNEKGQGKRRAIHPQEHELDSTTGQRDVICGRCKPPFSTRPDLFKLPFSRLRCVAFLSMNCQTAWSARGCRHLPEIEIRDPRKCRLWGGY